MDVPYEMLGNDRVVISLKDFEDMLDLIAYDQAKAKPEEAFPADLTLRILRGENRLKVFRKHRQLSQQDLSARSGVTQGLISDIENGKKTGSVTTLKALADVLGVEIDDLV